MRRYVWARSLMMIPLFFAVTFITFFIVRLSPGEPAALEAGSFLKLSDQAREKLNTLYGLDKPLWVQYGSWIGRVARLDFGNSFVDNQPAAQKIARALPVTAGLNFLTLFLAFWLGSRIGLLGAVKAGRVSDRFLSALSFAAVSIPSFWVALLLIGLFGVRLGWLPITGLETLFIEERPFLERAADLARHLILPVFSAAFGTTAAISRYARGSFMDAQAEPCVKVARAAGLSEKQIRSTIIFPNGLLPLITLLGLSVPAVIGGSVIFESVFSIPGMGRLFYQSVFQRDYPVVMGVLTLGSFLTILGNFLADLGCAWADPRIRSGMKK